jgi:hypothetical protein
MRWSSIWISLSDEDGFVTLAEVSSYVGQSFVVTNHDTTFQFSPHLHHSWQRTFFFHAGT